MILDLRLMSFVTIFKKLEKVINTNEVKEEIRAGKASYKFADYCKVSTGIQHFTHYIKAGKEIEIDKTAIIENYCKENGIEIVDETKEDYKITFTPSEKAYKEFNKMLDTVTDGQYRNIAKVASQVKSKIK